MERSRLTDSGTMMNGKTTRSRRGRTGSSSGMRTCSSLRSFFLLLAMGAILLAHRDGHFLAAPVGHLGEDHGQQPVPKSRCGFVRVDRHTQVDEAPELALVALAGVHARFGIGRQGG